MKNNGYVLAFDLGTGSVRTALVSVSGTILHLNAVEIETYSPKYGRVEQRPGQWWAALCAASQKTVQAAGANGQRIDAVVGCGQMHAPVLLDASEALIEPQIPLWNDKRAQGFVDEIVQHESYPHLTQIAGNPAATSWPGLKLAWMARHAPETLAQARWVLMPKDFINHKLTGTLAQDRTEAGSSFLYDTRKECWSTALASALGVPDQLLTDLHQGWSEVGRITPQAASATGLPAGLPVFAGGGDYPVSVLGSGVLHPGQASDITGTSSLLSLVSDRPLVHPQIMNAATPGGAWMAFSVVDAAGDAIRWCRRALEDRALDFEVLATQAAQVAPGAHGLMFLPYLTGERLGFGAQARAGFVGLTTAHGKPAMHRAILEGIALALKSGSGPMFLGKNKPERIIAAGGGARSDILLQIKAAALATPYVPVEEVECGLIGGAALAFTGLGQFADLAQAVRGMVRHGAPVHPDPQLVAFYEEAAEVFSRIRETLGAEWRHLSTLDARGSELQRSASTSP